MGLSIRESLAHRIYCLHDRTDDCVADLIAHSIQHHLTARVHWFRELHQALYGRSPILAFPWAHGEVCSDCDPPQSRIWFCIGIAAQSECARCAILAYGLLFTVSDCW